MAWGKKPATPKTSPSTTKPAGVRSYTSLRINIPIPRRSSSLNVSEDIVGDETTSYYSTYLFFRELDPGDGRTLFVCDVPLAPVYDFDRPSSLPYAAVSKSAALRAIFGRFGPVESAVAAAAEDARAEPDLPATADPSRYFASDAAGNDGDLNCRFGRVAFSSARAMRKALTAAAAAGEGRGDAPPGVTLGRLELRDLLDEDRRAADEEAGEAVSALEAPEPGALGLARRYRALGTPSRDALREWSDAVMGVYEEEERAAAEAREAATGAGGEGVPDADGFITVTHSTRGGTGGAKRKLQDDDGLGEEGARRGGRKPRRKKKKEISGASQLADFYRFQLRYKKVSEVSQLRIKFEEDKKRLAELKLKKAADK